MGGLFYVCFDIQCKIWDLKQELKSTARKRSLSVHIFTLETDMVCLTSNAHTLKKRCFKEPEKWLNSSIKEDFCFTKVYFFSGKSF